MGKTADRYTALQEAAHAVNHEIRIVAIPGPPVKPGQELTVKPFEADPAYLDDALSRLEKYLSSEEAAKRGELYRKRTEAADAERAALVAYNDARQRRREADRAVEDDTDGAVDDALAQKYLPTPEDDEDD